MHKNGFENKEEFQNPQFFFTTLGLQGGINHLIKNLNEFKKKYITDESKDDNPTHWGLTSSTGESEESEEFTYEGETETPELKEYSFQQNLTLEEIAELDKKIAKEKEKEKQQLLTQQESPIKIKRLKTLIYQHETMIKRIQDHISKEIKELMDKYNYTKFFYKYKFEDNQYYGPPF